MNIFKEFLLDETGAETIEIVIILVAIVAIGFAFKNTLINWFNSLLKNINDQAIGNEIKANTGTHLGE